MKSTACLLVLLVMMSSVPGSHAQSVTAVADASYNGVTMGRAENGEEGVSGGTAISTEAHSFQPVGGQVGPYSHDVAEAYAAASLPGTLRAYARAGGKTPDYGSADVNQIHATATARQVSNWRVESPSGGRGTTAIDLSAFYDGILYVEVLDEEGEVGLDTPVTAQVQAIINVVSAGQSTTVFDATTTLNLRFYESDSAPEFFEAWTNSFFIASTSMLPRAHVLIEQDYANVLEDAFTVRNNQDFTVVSILTVTADNPVGAFEIYATADYSNSGRVELSTNTPGATLVNRNPKRIPEPSTAALFGLALCVFRRMFRAERR